MWDTINKRLHWLTLRRRTGLLVLLIVALTAIPTWQRHRSALAYRRIVKAVINSGRPRIYLVDHDPVFAPDWCPRPVSRILRSYLSRIRTIYVHPDSSQASLVIGELPHTTGLVGVWFGMGCETPVTEVGEWRNLLARVCSMTRLRELSLYGTPTTDIELKEVRRLSNLRKLNLHGTHVTGVGLIHISHCRLLSSLWLSQTNLQDHDGSIASIARIPSLRALDLTGTKITDASIPDLSQLVSLERLSVSNLSDQGFERLRQALPECKLSQNQMPFEN